MSRSGRTAAEELASRLGCATTTARTLAGAAERSGLTGQLARLIGEWRQSTPEEEQGRGTLTTIVADEVGAYILELEVKCNNGARATRRPARITLHVEATTPRGEQACLGVPTEVTFLGDDGAYGHAELSRPVVAAGPISADEVAARIRETFLERRDDQGETGYDETAFMALAQASAREALAAGVDSDTMEVIVTTRLTISAIAPYLVTATAAAPNWPGHIGEGSASGRSQEQTLSAATHTAVEALRESIEARAFQAAQITESDVDEQAGDADASAASAE